MVIKIDQDLFNTLVVLAGEVFMYDKLLICGQPRGGTTWVFNTFSKYDTRLKYKTELDYHLGNESFDKTTNMDKLIQHVSNKKYFVSKLHGRHFHNTRAMEYVDLFDERMLLLRKDLFNSSLSLAISTVKSEWGVKYQLSKDSVNISCEVLHQAISAQWQGIRYLRFNQNRINYTQRYWLEDLKSDNDLWRKVTGKDLPDLDKLNSKTINMFESFRSPDKKTTAKNYNQCVKWYQELEPVLSPIAGLKVEDGMIYEI
jgi:hypothetical protein